MNFNIKYPPLVEQAYSYFLSIGLHPNKDKIYKMLVDEGMIDELGNPTQRAIDKGLDLFHPLEQGRTIGTTY